jgi:hypothetical protein
VAWLGLRAFSRADADGAAVFTAGRFLEEEGTSSLAVQVGSSRGLLVARLWADLVIGSWCESNQQSAGEATGGARGAVREASGPVPSFYSHALWPGVGSARRCGARKGSGLLTLAR